MRNNKRRAVDFCNDIRHCEGFARASHTQKHLVFKPIFEPLNQVFNRLWLVARGLILTHKFKLMFLSNIIHIAIIPQRKRFEKRKIKIAKET